MAREAIEATVRAIYEARRRGDGPGMAAHFHGDAVYCVAGDAAASPLVCHHAGPAMRDALARLNATLPVQSLQVVGLMVDGDRAAAEIVARLVFQPTGEAFETRWCDTFTFRDGKVAEVVEYLDTARGAQLMAGLA